MQSDDQVFHDDVTATARRLDAQLEGIDPAVALAAVLRLSALLAIRRQTRRGLFEVAVSDAYRDVVHELTQRARVAREDARPVAAVLPFRRAV